MIMSAGISGSLGMKSSKEAEQEKIDEQRESLSLVPKLG
jgi:hypothetical protein